MTQAISVCITSSKSFVLQICTQCKDVNPYQTNYVLELLDKEPITGNLWSIISPSRKLGSPSWLPWNKCQESITCARQDKNYVQVTILQDRAATS